MKRKCDKKVIPIKKSKSEWSLLIASHSRRNIIIRPIRNSNQNIRCESRICAKKIIEILVIQCSFGHIKLMRCALARWPAGHTYCAIPFSNRSISRAFPLFIRIQLTWTLNASIERFFFVSWIRRQLIGTNWPPVHFWPFRKFHFWFFILTRKRWITPPRVRRTAGT